MKHTTTKLVECGLCDNKFHPHMACFLCGRQRCSACSRFITQGKVCKSCWKKGEAYRKYKAESDELLATVKARWHDKCKRATT